MRLYLLVLFSVLFLVGCGSSGGVGSILGLDRRPPDEFSVVSRAPLTLPPNFTLGPSADRSRVESDDSLAGVVFGSVGGGIDSVGSGGDIEGYLLGKTDALRYGDDIRERIDYETGRLIDEDSNFVRRFLGTETEYGVKLDAQFETERLQETLESEPVAEAIELEPVLESEYLQETLEPEPIAEAIELEPVLESEYLQETLEPEPIAEAIELEPVLETESVQETLESVLESENVQETLESEPVAELESESVQETLESEPVAEAIELEPVLESESLQGSSN